MASWGHTTQWKSKLGQTERFYFSCRTTPLVSSCLLHALCQKISQLSGPNKGGKDAVDPGKPCVRSHRSWSPSTFPSTMRALSAPLETHSNTPSKQQPERELRCQSTWTDELIFPTCSMHWIPYPWHLVDAHKISRLSITIPIWQKREQKLRVPMFLS